MPLKKLLNFAASQGLHLTDQQGSQLLAYATCVWEKKDLLNLTSVQSLQEVLLRHICDGIVAAAYIKRFCSQTDVLRVADAGSGCGYIGISMAICLPFAQITLIESLQRRCKFMNWATLQVGISNAQVKNMRLGQKTALDFDVLTERAMGPLSEIGPLCLSVVKPGGIFLAFQGENAAFWKQGTIYPYELPWDGKTRHLVIYKKDEK